MTDSVWVIETGYGDDWAVLGIYTDKETAEQVASQLGGDETEVREWPLNPGTDGLEPGRHPYHVTMDSNGQLIGEPHRVSSIPDGCSITDRSNSGLRWVIGRVWATDRTHAMTIVNTYRRQARERGEL
jgi:hypothetical protein